MAKEKNKEETQAEENEIMKEPIAMRCTKTCTVNFGEKIIYVEQGSVEQISPDNPSVVFFEPI